jgi:hypothetical protein
LIAYEAPKPAHRFGDDMLFKEETVIAGPAGTHWAPLAYSPLSQVVATIQGTAGIDTIEGTLGNDVIAAFDGFDMIYGSSGIDIVDGGASYDHLVFQQFRGALNPVAGPRTFTVGADFVRDGTGDIDTTFTDVEAVELDFADLAENAASNAYGFDLSGFIGDAYMGRTKVSVNEVFADYTGSPLDDSLVSIDGFVTADGGGGLDDFFYIYHAWETESLSAYTDATGRHIVSTDGDGGAELTNFEGLAFQGEALPGSVLSADLSGLNTRIDWFSSDALSQTGEIRVIGTAFDDTFQFGSEADTFTGFGGYNTYRAYALWDDINLQGALFDGDVITDFSTLDTIDLSYTYYGAVPAAFIGTDPFSGQAGEVRYEKHAGRTLLMSDGDGDGVADATLTFTNGAFDLAEEVPGILIREASSEAPKRAIASDIDGNGTSDIVLRSASGELSYWLIDGTAITGSGSIITDPTDRFIVKGDFDGDGRIEPLLRNQSGIVGTAFGSISDPGLGNIAVGAGDLDDDGRADIVFRNGVDGAYAAWLIDGTAIKASGDIGNPGPGYAFVALADFDGDGSDDMLFRDADGTYAVWQMHGAGVAGGGAMGNPGASWFFAGIGDFDGDDRDDILFRNIDGNVGIWQIDGVAIVGGGIVADPGNWVIAGTGDYDGDGRDDILFRDAEGTLALWQLDGTTLVGGGIIGNPGLDVDLASSLSHPGFATLVFVATDGTVASWLVSGTTIVAGGTLGNPGPFWTALATGDLTGMGTTSVLFQGQDGRLAAWQSDGKQLLEGGGEIGNPGAEWSFRALDDFNGDGRDDILFQNLDGRYFVWNLADAQIVGGGDMGEAPGFEFVATGDLDADGKADIVLRDQATGEFAAWLVSGTTILDTSTIARAQGMSFAGMGDFDGDGADDILFRSDATGDFVSWAMAGADIVGGGAIGNPGGSRQISSIQDINQDGRDDLIFEDANGLHTAWILSGTQILASGTIGSEIQGWGML